MDGKEESLGTDGNSFLGLFSHHVCNGEPPNFSRGLKTTQTNQENSALLSLTSNSDRMVFLHLKHKNPSLLISIASQLFRLHLSRD